VLRVTLHRPSLEAQGVTMEMPMRGRVRSLSVAICVMLSACGVDDASPSPAQGDVPGRVADTGNSNHMDSEPTTRPRAETVSDSSPAEDTSGPTVVNTDTATGPDAPVDAAGAAGASDVAPPEDTPGGSASDAQAQDASGGSAPSADAVDDVSAHEDTSPADAGSAPEPPTPYVPVTVQSTWFEVSYLAPRTYAIQEPKSYEGNVSYLILGEERAVMFDTGAGENSPVAGTKIKHVIDQITDLPVTLLLSHFHYDHNQNLSEFDHIAFIELPHLVAATAPDGTYTFTQDDLLEGNYPVSAKVDEWWPVNTDIDLGNRSIQVVNIPGHTDESAMIVDYDNHMMFMGDYIYNGEIFVFGEPNLAVYEVTVDMLIATYDSSYAMYGAHGSPLVPHSDLQGLKDLLECIASAACTGESLVVWGYPAKYYSLGGMALLLFL
jgi:hydroxyacylglutathione hydrolase